jgi:DNA-binding ferritin-like protein (Dps family)
MDKDTAKEIQKLRNEIGELQMLLYATLAELKSLKALSTVLWEKQGVEMADGRTISEVLELLKKDIVDDKLKEFADSDMNLASKMRRRMEKYLKTKKPKE